MYFLLIRIAVAPCAGPAVPNCTPPSNGLCMKNESGLPYICPTRVLSMVPAALAVYRKVVGDGTLSTK